MRAKTIMGVFGLSAAVLGNGCVMAPADAGPLGDDSSPVIYGADSRREIYQLSGASLSDADGTVALFLASDVMPQRDGKTTALITEDYGSVYQLCPSERFYSQPTGAFCSGFLVAPKVVATAAHCVGSDMDAQNTRFVFGFRMFDATRPNLILDNSQIFRGTRVLAADSGVDWSLVELDRAAPTHKMLPIRRSGKIADGAALNAIGHPGGLPAKFADGANVRDNSNPTHFSANLDTYRGSSGGPVLRSSTHQVEGVQVRSEMDWVFNGSCNVSNVCPDSGCMGQTVTRTTDFSSSVPQWCVGDSGQWRGCRGSGCLVCPEKVPAAYVNYFRNHPNCTKTASCGGFYFTCSSACPAPGPADSCDGTPGEWAGCRGSGCLPCAELLQYYPKYIANHPNCTANTDCGGLYYTCSAACPAPTSADM